MNEIHELIKLSKYAGQRFDLVQAGGGNSSAKLDRGKMLIKASGVSLTEVDTDSGHVKVDINKIVDIMHNPHILAKHDKKERDKMVSSLLGLSSSSSTGRPSIETFLHVFLSKYTLHTHPVVVAAIISRKDWKKICLEIEPDALLLDYQTPGLDLAYDLERELHIYRKKHRDNPKVIFLQNHGIIVTDDFADEVIALNERIITAIEKYLGVNLAGYKMSTKVSALINTMFSTDLIAYHSSDAYLMNQLHNGNENLFSMPLCPDTLVYCGVSAVELTDLDDTYPINYHIGKYGEIPHVVFFKDNIFFIANNIKKARQIEEVYKAHIMTLSLAPQSKINYLSMREMDYLSTWEAEQYRQTV